MRFLGVAVFFTVSHVLGQDFFFSSGEGCVGDKISGKNNFTCFSDVALNKSYTVDCSFGSPSKFGLTQYFGVECTNPASPIMQLDHGSCLLSKEFNVAIFCANSTSHLDHPKFVHLEQALTRKLFQVVAPTPAATPATVKCTTAPAPAPAPPGGGGASWAGGSTLHLENEEHLFQSWGAPAPAGGTAKKAGGTAKKAGGTAKKAGGTAKKTTAKKAKPSAQCPTSSPTSSATSSATSTPTSAPTTIAPTATSAPTTTSVPATTVTPRNAASAATTTGKGK